MADLVAFLAPGILGIALGVILAEAFLRCRDRRAMQREADLFDAHLASMGLVWNPGKQKYERSFGTPARAPQTPRWTDAVSANLSLLALIVFSELMCRIIRPRRKRG